MHTKDKETVDTLVRNPHIAKKFRGKLNEIPRKSFTSSLVNNNGESNVDVEPVGRDSSPPIDDDSEDMDMSQLSATPMKRAIWDIIEKNGGRASYADIQRINPRVSKYIDKCHRNITSQMVDEKLIKRIKQGVFSTLT